MGKDRNNVPGEEGKPGDEGALSSHSHTVGTGGETPPTGEEAPKPEGEKKFTQEDLDRHISERLARASEVAEAKAAQEKADAEAEGKRKALKDQEKYKELAESLTADVAAKDTRIKELEAHEQRANDLEERLTKLVDADLDSLQKPLQDLRKAMTVEQWADYKVENPDLFKVADGKPAGSPASPTPPAGGNGSKDEAERRKKAVSVRQYW